jgi:hypothetical protein
MAGQMINETMKMRTATRWRNDLRVAACERRYKSRTDRSDHRGMWTSMSAVCEVGDVVSASPFDGYEPPRSSDDLTSFVVFACFTLTKYRLDVEGDGLL